ncbi:hypothetical protein IQ07DRAFT_639603 [Pyrenochaeta sp. DS3sAY3a]|nr:hypothetical protein IQ07DRAFT_639603 [Pyrenochaeta sp. DS3sAY3a]
MRINQNRLDAVIGPLPPLLDYTSSAVEHFITLPKKTFLEAAPVIFTVLQPYMIRHDFTSDCTIDRMFRTHMIGADMPAAHRFTVQLSYDADSQNMHDLFLVAFLSSNIMPYPDDPGSMILNGRGLRTLNLAATNPLDVHYTKIGKVNVKKRLLVTTSSFGTQDVPTSAKQQYHETFLRVRD